MIDRKQALARIEDIRARHDANCEERVEAVFEHLLAWSDESIMEIVRRPDVNIHSLKNGMAHGTGWHRLAEEFALEKPIKLQDFAQAIRRRLGGREAVKKLIVHVENERILKIAEYLEDMTNEEIREMTGEAGISKLVKPAKAILGFHLTITMLWTAAQIINRARILRQIQDEAFEAREIKRAEREELA